MDEFYIEINIDQNSKDLNLLFDAIKKCAQTYVIIQMPRVRMR